MNLRSKFKIRINYALRVIKRKVIFSIFWFLGGGYSFFSLFSREEKTIQIDKQVKNILIISLLRIGDTVVTTPAIRAIKERLPDVNLTMVILPVAYPVLKNNPFISSLIIYDKDKIRKNPIIEFYKFIKIIRKKYYELGIVMDYSFRSSLIAYLSGAPIRVGYNWLNKGFLLTHKLSLPKWVHRPGWLFKDDNSFFSEIDLKLKIIESLGIKAKDKTPQIFIDEKDRKFVEKFLKENEISEEDLLIGLHPGANEVSYRWNSLSFAKLAEILNTEYKAKIVITGGKKDENLGKEIVDLTNIPIISVCGKFSLEETFALIERLNLLISVDTGITHIASALKIPTIVLFGPGDPRIWRPYGNNHLLIQKDIECIACKSPYCMNSKHYCMELIKVEDVLEAVKFQLERIRR